MAFDMSCDGSRKVLTGRCRVATVRGDFVRGTIGVAFRVYLSGTLFLKLPNSLLWLRVSGIGVYLEVHR